MSSFIRLSEIITFAGFIISLFFKWSGTRGLFSAVIRTWVCFNIFFMTRDHLWSVSNLSPVMPGVKLFFYRSTGGIRDAKNMRPENLYLNRTSTLILFSRCTQLSQMRLISELTYSGDIVRYAPMRTQKILHAILTTLCMNPLLNSSEMPLLRLNVLCIGPPKKNSIKGKNKGCSSTSKE